MDTAELHADNVACAVLQVLFGRNESDKRNFDYHGNDHIPDLVGAVYDLVTLVASKSKRG